VLADGRLASGGDDGKIKLWPKEGTGEPVVLPQRGPVSSLAVLADGRLVSGGHDYKIKRWPKEGKGEQVVLSHGGVRSMAVLADGRLASGGEDGKIKLWPKEGTGEPVVLSQGSPVLSLAVLKDGRLASGGNDGKIWLWPKEGGQPGGPLAGQLGHVPGGAGGRAAGQWQRGRQDQAVAQGGTGQPVLLSQGSWVLSLAVLADGRLASGGDDGKIKLWLVGEQKLIAALCLRAGRSLTKDEWARYIGSDTPRQPSCRDLPSNWRTPD